jgi:polysaccharide biosynthesis/export protein
MRGHAESLIAAALVAAMTLGGMVGCRAESAYVWVSDLPLTSQPTTTVIGPRDTLSIDVKNQGTLSGEFVVGDSGDYRHPILGTIHVGGLTAEDAARELLARLADVVVKPSVSVSIIRTATVRVNVVGEVRTPGSYELTRGTGLLAALASAGWLTEYARRDFIFVLPAAEAGQRIRFRQRDLTDAEPHAAGFRLKDGDVVVVE